MEPMKTDLQGVALLPHLGVIRVQGEDAAAFLHGQLTQDFALLGDQQARLAAFCSAKGRMLASCIGFKHSPSDILLVCSRDLLAPALRRLSMFVMRAKARLSDASEDFELRGLAGLAGTDGAPWTLVRQGAATLVRLYPADGVARALWVAPVGDAPPTGPHLDSAAWLHAEVRSGVATLSAPVVEAFVPQMLNYESVGGVNFKKGCYPGQEVIARSQFRGTLKRRAFLAHCSVAMAPGQEIFSASDADQPCATVVQAAAAPGGGFDAIVSGQVAALQGQDLRLGSASGPPVHAQAAPYPLLEDI